MSLRDSGVSVRSRVDASLRGAFLVALACVAWATANARWLVAHRAGQPLNIDEAGYLGISLNYAFGWERNGVSGWLTSVLWPSQHAPLTTAVTSLALLWGSSPKAVALGVVLAFAVATLLLTAAVAAVRRDRTAVVLSLALVATTPGFITLARTFTFAVPAAAVTIAALYALVRSRGLISVRWSLVFGITVGLMPLARSMMIAFVPVLVAAAAVHAWAYAEGRRRRFANLGFATLLAGAVTAVWLVPSAHLVFGYLTKYGYGRHSAEYTTHVASPPLALLTTLGNEYYLPHMILLSAGWLIAGWGALNWIRQGPARARARSLLASPLFPLAAFVLGSYAALMTSKNAGFGFTIPLLAPAAIVAASGLARAIRTLRTSWLQSGAIVVVVLVCSLFAYSSFDSQSVLAEPRAVQLLGTSLTVTSGKGLDPAYTASDVDNLRNWAPRWDSAFDKLTSDVLDGSSTRPDMAFGFRGYFANVNVVELRAVERLHYGITAAQIDPVEVGNTKSEYRAWLTTGDAATSCHLMTSAGAVNEFQPLINTDALEAAALSVGFKAVDAVPTPDGRTVLVWERTGNGC